MTPFVIAATIIFSFAFIICIIGYCEQQSRKDVDSEEKYSYNVDAVFVGDNLEFIGRK